MEAAVKSQTESLLEILEEELGALLELAELLQKKAGALTRPDLDDMEDILSAEEEAVERLKKIERERAVRTDRLASILGISPEECRLKTLLERMDDGEVKRKIGDIRQKMRAAARRVSSFNRKADALASQRAAYTELMLNVFYGAANWAGKELYDSQGRLTEGVGGGRLDYSV